MHAQSNYKYNVNKFDINFAKLINVSLDYKNKFENLDCLDIANLFAIELSDTDTTNYGHKVGIMHEEVTESNFPILLFDAVLWNNQIYYIDIATKELKILTDHNISNLEVGNIISHLDSIITHDYFQKLFCVHEVKSKIIFLLKIKLLNIIQGDDVDLKQLYWNALLNEYIRNNHIPIYPSLTFRIYHLLMTLVRYKQKFMCTTDLQKWAICLNHIFALLHLTNDSHLLLDDLKLHNCAKAIKHFKNLKCVPNYFLGEIDLNSNKTKKHLRIIEKSIAKDIKAIKNFYIFILLKLRILDLNTDRVKFKRTFNDSSPKYTIRMIIPNQPILANILYINLDENKEITLIRCLDDNRQLQEIHIIKNHDKISLKNKHKTMSIEVAQNSLTFEKLQKYLIYPPALGILIAIGFYTPQIEPLGLALKFAIQHSNHQISPLTENDLRACQQVLDEITHYCNLFQLLDYSMWDHHADIESIIRHMHFDQYYTLPQLPPKFFTIITRIFNHIEVDNSQFKEELKVLNELFSRNLKYTIHKINFSESKVFGVQSLYKLIENISSQFLNNSYLSNWNKVTSSFNDVPLSIIFQKNLNNYYSELFFINHPCLNLLSFEYLLNSAKAKYTHNYIAKHPNKDIISAENKFGDEFGKAFEKTISNELSRCNVIHQYGLKYFKTDNPHLDGAEAECDVIVEAQQYILLFECKTKLLSHQARSGDNLSLIMDVYSGFLHSQYQACKVKHLLKKQGYIKFNNGLTMHHNNRTIITVSVAFLEYFQSLMDKHYIRSMFEFFVNREFTATVKLSDKLQTSFNKFNVTLQKFRDMNFNSYTSDMFFLSLQQILTILEYSTNNDEFVKNLLLDPAGGKLLTGYKDWYVDFFYARRHGFL